MIKEHAALLAAMLADAKEQSPLYQPGPYWARTADEAASEIRQFGLSDFRGTSNLIGKSFTDSIILDWRHNLRTGSLYKRIFYWIFKNVFPFNQIYQNQVNLTAYYFNSYIAAQTMRLTHSKRALDLLARYTIPSSCDGGCISKIQIDDKHISLIYLDLLDQHDHATRLVDFSSLRSMIEIGGGFGTNLHLLLANYPNIRKVIYLDIPPNLYVGTQYLRAHFGERVTDYLQIKQRNSLDFSNDDKQEIYCIAPWQIELLRNPPDALFNSHSFVEMPFNVVQNYAEKAVNRFKSDAPAIILTSYGGFDPSTTLDPDRLPEAFPERRDFIREVVPSLIQFLYPNRLYVAPGGHPKSSSHSRSQKN